MKTTPVTEEIYNYVINQCDLPHPILDSLATETSKLTDWFMQISRDQGALMHMLVKLINAKKIVEVGCYTGYSAICMATALPEGGKLVTLDISEENARFAKRYFSEAGLSEKIDVRVAPAVDTLAKMQKEFGAGSFDLAFIDADKESLPQYFESCLTLLRKNGLMLVDNVLWSGKVVGQADQTPPAVALRTFNKKVLQDKRVERVMLHISDGIYLLRKIY